MKTMINPKNKSIFKMLLEITKDLGILNRKKWLDIGCGNGELTSLINKNNINCIGIDVEFKEGFQKDDLISLNLLRLIKSNGISRNNILESNPTYIWPCKSESIQFAFSSSVIEHIINMEEFVSENSRVIEYGGYCAHYFPSRFCLLEPHTGIPLGALFVNKKYYKVATKFGLCKKNFRDWKVAMQYMKGSTNYLNEKELIKIFKKNEFEYMGNRNDLIIKYMGPKSINFLFKFNIICFLFGIFRSKLLIFKKSKELKLL